MFKHRFHKLFLLLPHTSVTGEQSALNVVTSKTFAKAIVNRRQQKRKNIEGTVIRQYPISQVRLSCYNEIGRKEC